ncbi:MAG: O-antigen ligase family protein [Lachnospiraceae bacterium]|nr:O-antigen ligase family protein [Lachnospiraceae bacterium]
MKEKTKGLLDRDINFNYWREDTEGFLTNFLVIIALSFPVIELIAVMCGHNHIFMAPLLRIFGVVGFVILLAIFFNNKNHSFCISDFFLLLSVLFTVISVVFSKSKLITFTGAAENHSEDPFQVLGYFVIFFMATHIASYDNRKKLIIAILIVAVLNNIPAILQHLQLWPFEVMAEEPFNPAFGLTLHFNFYGAISVMFSAISGMVFMMKKTKHIIAWYVAALLCFVAAMFSGSRLTWVGLVASFGFVIVLELYYKLKGIESILSVKRYALLVISFAIICALLIVFDDIIVSQIVETTKELESGDVTQMGTGRMNMWLVGLESIKDYPLTGVGLDNFVYCYELHPEYDHGWIGYKAHNEYLQVFVTQGVLAGVNYIVMCLYTVLFGIKTFICEDEDSKNKAIAYILVIMIVGYFCQAFFNNSATNISPYKWLVMGLILTRCKQKEMKRDGHEG